MATVYLKYDPFYGQSIPDGFAQQKAAEIVAAVEYGDKYTIANELVLTFVRVLIKQKATDPMNIVFQLPDVPDQHADHNGRLKQWHKYDFNFEALSALL